jgi:hypothetical protein
MNPADPTSGAPAGTPTLQPILLLRHLVLQLGGPELRLLGIQTDQQIADIANYVRASWGRQPNFVLAVGGLNPRFPPPAGFPKLARLSLSLGDSDNPRLRFESYLALTSNTVQFGARLDFSYTAAGFTLASVTETTVAESLIEGVPI